MIYKYDGDSIIRFTLQNGDDVCLSPGMTEDPDLPSTDPFVQRLEAAGSLKKATASKAKKTDKPSAKSADKTKTNKEDS